MGYPRARTFQNFCLRGNQVKLSAHGPSISVLTVIHNHPPFVALCVLKASTYDVLG